MNAVMATGGCLLLFTAALLISSLPHPNGAVLAIFFGDLIFGVALLVCGFSE